MSTLSAARADNFYYPPGWDPSKESLNQHTGHTKGRNQYEQKGLIRFELPFDGWCTKCGRHVAKGVRFNASKKADGKYHSTTIWKFGMGCPGLCGGAFVVRTDPKSSDYVFEGDLRRKVEEYSSDEEQGHKALGELDHRDQAKELSRRRDPMQSLERKQDDRERARERAAALQRVRDRSDRADDDYGANALLRRRHRSKRKEASVDEAKARGLGLAVELVQPSEEDAAEARAQHFQRARREPARVPLHAQSIFGGDRRARTAATLRRDRNLSSLRLRPRTGTRQREPTPLVRAKRRRK